MKKICIITATRAEYGLLKNLIIQMRQENKFEIDLVVTGAHLHSKFGNTYKEIEEDGIFINKKISILESEDSVLDVNVSMANAICKFADYFKEQMPDLLLVLGDRYEILAIAIAAMNQQVPIAHLHGGEITEGALDDVMRHAITKLSYLHFVSTEEYRNRVIQMGENPERVYNVGALGVENILCERLMNKETLEDNLEFSLKGEYALVTYHSVTLEPNQELQQLDELLAALDLVVGMRFIITKSNADAGGIGINNKLDEYAQLRKNKVLVVHSLGRQRYLTALKYAAFVIGNSSSGIIEAPSFNIPTVNIGERQRGRIKASSIIDCSCERTQIFSAIQKARTDEMRILTKSTENPYRGENTTNNIIKVLNKYLQYDIINLKKKFYDL